MKHKKTQTVKPIDTNIYKTQKIDPLTLILKFPFTAVALQLLRMVVILLLWVKDHPNHIS